MQTDTLSNHDVRIGDGRCYRNITLFPLFGAAVPQPDYLTLDEALAAGAVEVKELDQGASVNHVQLNNRSTEAVLLLDGETLLGSWQDRVLNVSILASAVTSIAIPVSCVEAGRWHARSGAFRTAKSAMFAASRARKADAVTRNLRHQAAMNRQSGRRDYDAQADQSEVWQMIAARQQRVSQFSPTAAMQEMFDNRAADLDNCAESLPPLDGQCGAIIAIGREIVGLDLFDCPQTYAKLWPKLAASYALDALAPVDERADGPALAAAHRFLSRVREAATERHPSIGEGEDIRLAAEGISGGALYARGRAIHLCAFVTQATPA